MSLGALQSGANFASTFDNIMAASSVHWLSNLSWKHFLQISQTSSSSYWSISLTKCSSAHDMNWRKAKVTDRTFWLSMRGRDGKTSRGQRCHILSGVSQSSGSVKSSSK